jgi:uncharacterized protein YndB with AHSA1/START domain
VFHNVTFTEQNGKTKLRWEAVVVKSSPELNAALEGMEEGCKQSLDRLDEELVKV